MHFLDLLDILVVRKPLLSLLSVNDLLRLRRVSKSSKNLVEDFIRIEKVGTRRELKTEFHRQITEDDDEDNDGTTSTPPNQQLNILQIDLNELCIPIFQRVYFSELDTENSSIFLYSVAVKSFAESWGSHVTHLTFHTLGLPVYSKSSMLAFLESFPNVTHLVIQEVITWRGWTQGTNFGPAEQEIKIPSNFRNLKSLCITNSNIPGDPIFHQNVFDYITKIVETCLENLKELSLPFRQFLINVERTRNIGLACICLYKSTPDLKLFNVDGYWINNLLKAEQRTPEMGSVDFMLHSMKEKVISIRNPMDIPFLERLPNLERVEFTHMSRWTIPRQELLDNSNWPKLKELKVDATLEYPHRRRVCGKILLQLWTFLLSRVRREQMVKLDISLEGFADEFERYPGTNEIVRSCPNLKVLKIGYWCREHGTLPKLWGGLPLLEELYLDHCTGMGNIGFVGDDFQSPALLQLKNLKTLELGSMEKMLVTDDLFSQLICNISLKKLCLSSNGPVQSVTLNGIKSLLAGKFANTIERFSLRNLQLACCCEQDKKSIESQFRSSQMI